MELEAIRGREIPPELILLPHHQRETAAKRIEPIPRREAENLSRAAGGKDKTRKHLERGCLAGTVGAEKCDHFAGFDREAHAIDRAHIFRLSAHQPAQGSKDALFFLRYSISFREVDGFDRWH